MVLLKPTGLMKDISERAVKLMMYKTLATNLSILQTMQFKRNQMIMENTNQEIN